MASCAYHVDSSNSTSLTCCIACRKSQRVYIYLSTDGDDVTYNNKFDGPYCSKCACQLTKNKKEG